jgi:hypothetical protein
MKSVKTNSRALSVAVGDFVPKFSEVIGSPSTISEIVPLLPAQIPRSASCDFKALFLWPEPLVIPDDAMNKVRVSRV